ncbi:MAG: hypothetical protein LBT54_05625, partial [Bifidobacteriaceae bacterium]|nr:hypothetical protein [Bifidobacteriaceae bacterium]
MAANPRSPDRPAAREPSPESTPSATLKVDHAVRALLEAEWPERWEMLRSDGRLMLPSVAKRLSRQDSLLGLVVAQAARVGVDAVEMEFPLAFDVARIADGSDSDADYGVRAVSRAVEGGLGWAFPVITAAAGRLAPIVEGKARHDLTGAALWAFTREAAVDPDLVAAAWKLSTMDWKMVWAKLPRLRDLAGLARAAQVVRDCRALLDPDDPAGAWAGELAGLARAAQARGVKAAIEEHRLIQAAMYLLDASASRMPPEQRLKTLSGLAGVIAVEFDKSGASWILPAAVDACKEAERVAGPSHPDYP